MEESDEASRRYCRPNVLHSRVSGVCTRLQAANCAFGNQSYYGHEWNGVTYTDNTNYKIIQDFGKSLKSLAGQLESGEVGAVEPVNVRDFDEQIRKLRDYVESIPAVVPIDLLFCSRHIIYTLSPLPVDLGVMRLVALNDEQLRGLEVFISGYPLDKPPGTQWYDTRTISAVASTELFYDIDTEIGDSGAPIFAYREGVAYAVGVHRYGTNQRNFGTRITGEVLADIGGPPGFSSRRSRKPR